MGKLGIGERYKIRLDNGQTFSAVVHSFTKGIWLGATSPALDVAIVEADPIQFLMPASGRKIPLQFLGVFDGERGSEWSPQEFPGAVFLGRLLRLRDESVGKSEIGYEDVEEFVDRISMEPME